MLKHHIQTIEVPSGGATAIMFSGIPQNYHDLQVVSSLRVGGGSLVNGIRVEFNSNTSSVYSVRNLQAIYSSPNSNSNPYNTTTGMVLSFMPSPSQTANTFSNTSFYIPNYSSSTQSKTVSAEGVSENNSAFGASEVVALNISAGLFASNSPISSIRVSSQDGNNLAQFSSISLYGIKRGSDGRTEVASGGTITTSGGFTIHTFNTSGTFVANRSLNAEYLVIAGGGPGGGGVAGGGGAGGYRTSVGTSGGNSAAESAISLSAGTSYAVTVGAGGTRGATEGTIGTNGSNSVFSSITSTGGGYGGTFATNGNTGGSGGGAGRDTSPGAGTSNQGFAGGSETSSVNVGAGGGGAGAVGQSVSSTSGGNGGIGIESSITGSATYRAGGGGGAIYNVGGTPGTGGLGGGGNGNGTNSTTRLDGFAGTANTGGGGGGGSGNGGLGGNGGSGIVVVRYLTPA